MAGTEFVTDEDDAFLQKAMLALQASSEPLAADRTASLLARHYGVVGTSRTLSSEAENTILIDRASGGPLILKTSSRAEGLDSFRFQTSALAGLEGQAGFVTPRLVRTVSGDLQFLDEGTRGYLQTCVAGTPLATMPASPALLGAMGQALGRLDVALGRMTLPVIHRPVLWSIRCWPGLNALFPYLPEGAAGDTVRLTMRHYAERIQPELDGLAWQVIHNDPSPFNTFAAAEGGIAFIDFGDGGWAPRIQDLAIAASHFVTDPTIRLGGAEALIAGYASVIPLSRLEARLLVGLMRARQSAVILINAWRVSLFPAEASYINKSVARAALGLSILAPLSDDAAEAAVREAICQNAAEEGAFACPPT